jgi:dolichol-phosphate mannosyltransferase
VTDPSERPSRILRWGAGLALVLLTGIKLWCAVQMELLPEEAYYWTYLQHPALSYFDHPPMVAWLIGAGTWLVGNSELGVRLGSILLGLASCGMVFWLTRLWFGRRAAWWAVLLFSIIPLYFGTGLLAFPDGPLIFFWLFTLVALSEVFVNNRPGFWCLAGLGLGGALLSKYTAILLVPSLLLFFAFAPEHRRLLRRLNPWLAGSVALAVFSPVIIWNATHDWASFIFQSTRAAGQKAAVLHNVGGFWLVQILIITPLLCILLANAGVQGIRRGWRQRLAAWNFAAAFAVPLFLVFVLAGFKTWIHINWTAPAFLSLVPAAAMIFSEATMRSRRWRVAGWIGGGLSVAVLGVALSSLVCGSPEMLAYSRAGGWRELADEVERAEHALEIRERQEPFILGADKYNLSAELSFYTRETEEQLNVFALGDYGLAFRYWSNREQWEGHPAIIVLTGTNATVLRRLAAYFERLDAPQTVSVPSLGKRSRTVYLLNAYGYHTDPIPEDPSAMISRSETGSGADRPR